CNVSPKVLPTATPIEAANDDMKLSPSLLCPSNHQSRFPVCLITRQIRNAA
ncbi:hypothetical protein ACTXT7_017044, partial [Hymenolepis weldensis]